MSRKRLSDTSALAAQRINPPRAKLAVDEYQPDSADGAVANSSTGKFRRETGVGDRSLAEACRTACGDERDDEEKIK